MIMKVNIFAKFRIIVVVLVLTLASHVAMAKTTIIYAGELLAVPGEKPVKKQTIVINDKKITQILNGYVSASTFEEGSTIIDLKDSFVLPGLMDMHVHLQSQLGPDNDKDSLKMSDQLMAMRSTSFGMKTLLAGFTTVRDAGSNTQYMFAYRDAIEKGWIEGPRIIAASGVGITGGHADISGVKPELLEFYTDKSICDGPYDCRRATRRAI